MSKGRSFGVEVNKERRRRFDSQKKLQGHRDDDGISLKVVKDGYYYSFLEIGRE